MVELDKLISNFKLRNIEVTCYESLKDAKEKILSLVPKEAAVGVGHSATLQELNITNELMHRGNIVYDKELAKDKEDCKGATRCNMKSIA